MERTDTIADAAYRKHGIVLSLSEPAGPSRVETVGGVSILLPSITRDDIRSRLGDMVPAAPRRRTRDTLRDPAGATSSPKRKKRSTGVAVATEDRLSPHNCDRPSATHPPPLPNLAIPAAASRVANQATSSAPAPFSRERVSGGRQLYLDLGQKSFGPQRCPQCGLLYTKGVRADEALHKAFHAGVKGGIPISGWRQETVVSRDGSSRVVLFRAADERLCRKDRLGDAVRALFGGEMDSGTRGGGAGAAHKDAWVLLRVRKGRVDACLAFRCRVQRALVRWEAAGKEARSGDGGAACRALENGRGWAEGGESGSGVTDKSRKDSQGSGEIQSREKGPHVENGPKPVLIVVGWWECADAGTTGRNLSPALDALLCAARKSAVAGYLASWEEVSFADSCSDLAHALAISKKLHRVALARLGA